MPNRPRNLDSPLVTTVIKYMSRAQTWAYRRTGGRVGGRWRIGAGFRKPVPTLLLEHRGRKSGKLFTAPLLYLVDGPDLVVVASQGGLPDHPQWYFNLLAHPTTRVQIGAEHRRVRARVASPEEKNRLWPLLVDLYADFDTYQSWTEREIPVLILQPEDSSD
ncbi:nitroreductase family deazaflavin-dependent oxidoreductase [Nocardia implantans]|uniref:Nitroreductase family deazaflavin-dependent oxidoreductase n=1 Tax=Nocardia implantans TaxID=3108168 RepID=A0ABU6B040_9NOCA|nr:MULTISPECIES: nitroreductase family deazaflavin-dependent oxidoreductase [unclassified Nocardia]MBF6194057.1 nitroreductase family deazaflavin-dependent oxidoreductase [Nocardia beijingensis]MEA3529664.1 nitroreductase family deazaflavin-dependent oxidoreductase [Nocardia sp. CDC192]MEB3512858.1 nitroreductase family deazaflavin-dependent oxidoreductase [Nocardia sp. CDC186]